jgi:hypothetical protein
MIDFSDEDRAKALEETKQNWRDGKSQAEEEPSSASGVVIRGMRDKRSGLLLIYPLDPQHVNATTCPVIGFAVSFPRSGLDATVNYVVNNVYFEQEFSEE